MFYTKYRPRKFSEFLGSETLIGALQKAIYSNNFPHAYFLYGPRGVGKTTMARLIAKSLNCKDYGKMGSHPNTNVSSDLGGETPNSDPCGTCDNCIAIENGSFIDLMEIDAASNRGIDDVRALRDKVALSPALGKYKVYIIDEVHMLTPEAFNALLKTLEEPPKHAIFILCTTEFKKVPETIRSRCQKFQLGRATIDDLVKKLRLILDSEKKEKTPIPDLSDTDLKIIAKAALGGFRDAETMLEQVVFGEISVDQLITHSNTEDLAVLVSCLVIKPDAKEALLILEKSMQGGVSAEVWADGFLEYLQNLLFAKAGIGEEAILTDKIKEITLTQISLLIKTFGEAKRQIKYAAIPFLPLQVAAVDLITEKLVDTRHSGEGAEATDSRIGFNADSGRRTPSFARMTTKDTDSGLRQNDGGSGQPRMTGNFSIEKLYEAVRPLNHSVEALLRSCKIIGFNSEDDFVIEAFYSFHKERLNSATNKKIVETALETLLGKPVAIKVVLSEKKPAPKEDLSDRNVALPPENKIKEAWEVLDGKAPI